MRWPLGSLVLGGIALVSCKPDFSFLGSNPNPPLFDGAEAAIPVDSTTISLAWRLSPEDTPDNYVSYLVCVSEEEGRCALEFHSVPSSPGCSDGAILSRGGIYSCQGVAVDWCERRIGAIVDNLKPSTRYYFIVRATFGESEKTSKTDENSRELTAQTLPESAGRLQQVSSFYDFGKLVWQNKNQRATGPFNGNLTALAVGPEGKLYVSDGFSLFTLGPKSYLSLVMSADRIASVGHAFAVGPDGSFYQTTGRNVERIDATGKKTDLLAVGKTPLVDAQGLTFDEKGNLFVADEGADKIFKIDPTGQVITIVGTGVEAEASEGVLATEASLKNPTGVIVTKRGLLAIVERSVPRLRGVDLVSGRMFTIAGNGQACDDGDYSVASDAAIRPIASATLTEAGDIVVLTQSPDTIKDIAIRKLIMGSSRPVIVPVLYTPPGSKYLYGKVYSSILAGSGDDLYLNGDEGIIRLTPSGR